MPMSRKRSKRRTRRLLGGLAAIVTIAASTGCTPEEQTWWNWWTSVQTEAHTDGLPGPHLAGDLAARQLPEQFLAVIWRESNCDPTAVNARSGALGLTQIMPAWLGPLCEAGVACTEAEMLEPATNLDAAAFIFAAQGWQAWSVG